MGKYNHHLFAEYVLKNVCQPKDWDENFGAFPPRAAGMRNYILHLVQPSKDSKKLAAICNYYFPERDEQSKTPESYLKEGTLLEEIKRRARTKSIEKFFKGKSTPKADVLQFLAILFDLPVKSIREFDTLKPDDEGISDLKTILARIHARFTQHARLIGILFGLLLIPTFLYIFTYLSQQGELRKKDKLIEQLSFHPQIVTSAKLVQGEISSIAPISLNDADDESNPLSFHTNNIYNTHYLIPEKSWTFSTDPNGEDINSQYGQPYEGIRGTQKTAGKTSIANGKIKIRFSVFNNGTTPLVIDNMFIEILELHKVTDITLKKGIWGTNDSETSHKVNLKKNKRIYPMELFVKLPAHTSAFIALNVKVDDEALSKYITKFNINIGSNNGVGERFKIKSDKDFLIGGM